MSKKSYKHTYMYMFAGSTLAVCVCAVVDEIAAKVKKSEGKINNSIILSQVFFP